jgi:hypothetical protein
MKARDVPNGLQVRYEGALYAVCHVSHGIEGEIPYLSGGGETVYPRPGHRSRDPPVHGL